MQGSHKEGEFRQLEMWTWKSYARLPILHNSKWAETLQGFFMEYLRNIGANKYQRGPPGGHNPPGRAREPRRALVGCAHSGPPPVPLFFYISHFDLEKIRRRLSGRSTAVSRRNLGRSTFALRRSDSAGGTSLLEGKSSSSSSPTTLHLARAISINIFNNTISSQTLVHLLCSIFIPEPQIGTCGWLVVLITSCSWLLYGLFGGRLYVQIQYLI